MSIPTSIAKVVLNFGAWFDHSGRPLRDEEILIECLAAPIYSTTGDVVVAREVRIQTDNDGTANVPLVACDAPTLSRQNFTYRITPPASVGPAVDVFLPLSVPFPDFDALIPLDPSDGDLVLAPVETLEDLEERVTALETGGIVPSSGIEVAFASPQSTWIATHPFGRRPSVKIYLSSGEEVEADVYATPTTASVSFPSPTSGSLVLT